MPNKWCVYILGAKNPQSPSSSQSQQANKSNCLYYVYTFAFCIYILAAHSHTEPNRIGNRIERERERAHFHSNVCLNASCRLCCSSRLPLLLYALFARSFTYCSTIWYWIHYSYQISSKHLIRSHVQPMFNCNQWTAGQQWVYPATLPLAKLQKKKRQHTENGGTMMAALSFVLCVCVCSAIVPHQHSTAQQKCVRHADVQCIFSLISKSENLNTAN